eukprot:TRINITY_DN22334_c0_g1_i1.p1 TRINITY_DN22334_c0_g1~~TRINITY_DN22334_c0_g1_i1.p1  ORF type:complete len:320 (+),score=66.35 TRINITY_DN22334_c0_g1_i1:71-961(+)
MSIVVRQALLDRVVRRRNQLADSKPVDAPTLSQKTVPEAWLQRLESGIKRADDDEKIKRSSRSRLLNGRSADALHPGNEALIPWLTKLKTELQHAELQKASTRHLSEDALAARAALQKERSRQCLEEYCVAATNFLNGPRQLREKFGSVLDGTEHRTDEVVMDEIVGLREAGREFSMQLRRMSLAARAHVSLPITEESELPFDLRQQVDEALEDSEKLLAKCASCGWIDNFEKDVGRGASHILDSPDKEACSSILTPRIREGLDEDLEKSADLLERAARMAASSRCRWQEALEAEG